MPASKKLLESLISEVVSKLLMENPQQAEKVYFKPGRLGETAKKQIFHITKGDAYTKIVADMYYLLLYMKHKQAAWALSIVGGKEEEESEVDISNSAFEYQKDFDEVVHFYESIKSYDKNVFPIKNFNLTNSSEKNLRYILHAIGQRRSIIENMKKLPSVAYRNMKADTRLERDGMELQYYRSKLETFLANLSLLSNRDDRYKQAIYRKLFKANTTLDQMDHLLHAKENIVGGKKFNKATVRKMVKDQHYPEELQIVYDSGSFMVIEVDGPKGIKEIGCNSLWCFTYSKDQSHAWRQWNEYSTNGIVYVIINFSLQPDDIEFMHVLIKPFDTEFDEERGELGPLFDMSNESVYNPIGFIDRSIGLDTAKKILNFGVEPIEPEDESDEESEEKEKEIIDPNQLKLDLQELRKQTRQAILENHSQAIVNFQTGDITANGEKVGEMDLIHKGGKNPYNGFGYLYLSRIFIEKPFRGKGYAHKAMEQLINYADQQKLIITLTPANDWGAGVSRLTKWYRSFGFVPNKGRNKDWNHRDGMHRLPL